MVAAALAGLAWAAIILMVLTAQLSRQAELFAPARVAFYGLLVVAGLLTFLPLEIRLHLPGLTFEGLAGGFLTFYTLAFVPPPTSWLLSPPDAPLYVIFAAAIFWFVSAIALPAAFTIGQRVFRQRARQYDLRRARRQAHEVGAAAAVCVLLAGLRVLTLIGALLVVLIVFVTELLVLSFLESTTPKRS
jgi:hypothetical protein